TMDSERGFSGYHIHARSGLFLPVFRFYSPALGRWLSRDPSDAGEARNLYRYTGNSPSNNVDPLGLYTLTEIIDYVKKNNKSKYLRAVATFCSNQPREITRRCTSQTPYFQQSDSQSGSRSNIEKPMVSRLQGIP
ncbi:MAG: RHS repeat-associated core domain-containing protein, partial [Candidatus Obscuribacterales bacterium]|nr:RHS repeat-associated core domain-containing protein [Candidatus Obscuribacterales bacterium]